MMGLLATNPMVGDSVAHRAHFCTPHRPRLWGGDAGGSASELPIPLRHLTGDSAIASMIQT
jgi:hypothetical protein